MFVIFQGGVSRFQVFDVAEVGGEEAGGDVEDCVGEVGEG